MFAYRVNERRNSSALQSGCHCSRTAHLLRASIGPAPTDSILVGSRSAVEYQGNNLPNSFSDGGLEKRLTE